MFGFFFGNNLFLTTTALCLGYNWYIALNCSNVCLYLWMCMFSETKESVLTCNINDADVFDCRENLSITCFMDMENTRGQMAHFMRETSLRTSKI